MLVALASRMDLATNRFATPAIVLTALACVAFFLARGTVALVGGAVFESSAAYAPGVRGEVPTAREVSPDDVLRRNIFDSARGSLLAPPPEPVPPVAAPSRCDGGWRLTATFFDSKRPEASIAAILDASGSGRLYRTGQRVGTHSLVGIRGRYVHLESAGERCQLQMFADERATAVPTGAAGARDS